MLLPTLLQLLMLYRVWTSLYQFAGLCQGCRFENLMFWNLLGWKFFRFCSLLAKPFAFSLSWENFCIPVAVLSHFSWLSLLWVPLWVQLGCSSIKGFLTNQLFWNSAWTFFFPSFPSQAVRCYFFKFCSWTLFAASLTLLYSVFWLWISFFGAQFGFYD